ncbi:MAG: LysR family transcriptional regulator [Marinobacterium sp.]|nr:LysR family transcriptional regulator [Marinobacterium sp.]
MNIRGITLKHLRVFTAVARDGSLTQAAERLFITKSAASMALTDLEKLLGQPLFERHRNRLILNSSGERLRPLADELLQRMETIEATLHSEQLNGHLRIGASNTVGNHLLPALVGGFLRQYGCDRPELLVRNTAVLEQRLDRFELDVALVEGRVQNTKLISQPWQTDQMLVIAPPDHPLADNRLHQPAELDCQDWVMREPDSGTRQQFYHLLESALQVWQLAFEINTNEAVINAVAAGLGLGFISHLAARDAIEAERVKVIELDHPTLRQLYTVYHRDKYQGPLLKEFIRFCQHWQH